MTAEQLSQMFRASDLAKGLDLTTYPEGGYVILETRAAYWGFLACARALELKLKDAERYQWLRSDNIEVLPGQREINVYMERLPHTEEPDVFLIEKELDDAIDAAMSAALEEEKNASE